MSWEKTTVSKLNPAPPPSLGQDAFTEKGRSRKIPRGQLKVHLAQHATCVDHVKVDGLAKPVCVLRGQDPDAVVAEARALAGLDR